MKYLLLYVAVMSGILLITMGDDKTRAKRHKWRISERTLFLLAAVGGAAGGCLGMLLFRHKTRHLVFEIGFPLLLVIQILVLWLVWKNQLPA